MLNIVVVDIIGMIGVVIILITYFLLQTQSISSKQLSYSVLNLIGSAMILFSLFFAWNLPAAVVEGAWVLISLYGIFAYVYKRKRD